MQTTSINVISKMRMKTNFTHDEKNLLLDFVRINSTIMENKSNDVYVIKAKKEKWIELSNIFALHGFNRDWQRLREFYQRAKSNAKKMILNFQKYHRVLNKDGPPPDNPSDLDWALYDISPGDFSSETREEKVEQDCEEDSDQQTSTITSTIIKEDQLDISESSNTSAAQDMYDESNLISIPLDICESTYDITPPPKKKSRKQKISIIDEELLKTQIEFLEKRNRREQELHEAKMRVEHLKMRNEELLAEKLKLEIERLK